MKELSIFVDESGDFGEYDYHSPYYIISFVFHEQSKDINTDIEELNQKLSFLGIGNQAIHTGPLIRQEREYHAMSLQQRQRVLSLLLTFFKKVDISCKTLLFEKKHSKNYLDLISSISKELSLFLKQHLEYFLSFDKIKIYYDRGQYPVTLILSSVFNFLLSNVTLKEAVKPSKYRLFQVADMLCTIELVNQKMKNKNLSKSELRFFVEPRIIKKKYIKPINHKILK